MPLQTHWFLQTTDYINSVSFGPPISTWMYPAGFIKSRCLYKTNNNFNCRLSYVRNKSMTNLYFCTSWKFTVVNVTAKSPTRYTRNVDPSLHKEIHIELAQIVSQCHYCIHTSSGLRLWCTIPPPCSVASLLHIGPQWRRHHFPPNREYIVCSHIR